MPTHDTSFTAVAYEEITQYSIVKFTGTETNGLMEVRKCNNAEDTVVGVCMLAAEAGDLVSIRLPFSGLMPAYAYSNVKPGDPLSIGITYPGSLTNTLSGDSERAIAYVVQTGNTGAGPSRCMVLFTRSYFM